jgi:hypothetical protein
MAVATKAQTSMDVEGRRDRLERARAAAKRLEKIDAVVQDALARLPGLARELTEIRAELEDALAPDQEEN